MDRLITKQFVNVINAQAKLIEKLLHNQKHLLKSIRALSGSDSLSSSTSALTNWHHFSQNHLKNHPDQSEDKFKLLPIKKTKNLQRNELRSCQLKEGLDFIQQAGLKKFRCDIVLNNSNGVDLGLHP